MITSDAGILRLREVDRKYGILGSFSQCFTDYRDSRYIDHAVEELVSQRVYGISAGYEDVNDHDRLRNDSLLATICEKEDPEGKGRKLERDKGKAEYFPMGENPRFVVTSISREEREAKRVYEKLYCGRGDMENRVKEQQLQLFSDRTSSATMRANQLRLWFSCVAYVLLNLLREKALKGTEFANLQCESIRVKLLKIGAQVKVSVRRACMSIASGYPYQGVFLKVLENIKRAPPLLCKTREYEIEVMR